MRSTPALSGLRTSTVPADTWNDLVGCPVCTAGVVTQILVTRGRTEGTTLALCEECGHLFHRRRPSPAWFDEFYASEWDRRGRTQPSRSIEPDFSTVDRCLGHLTPGARVFDAGAGLGHAVAGFRARGFEAVALERSAHRAARLRDLGFETYELPLEQVELSQSVDLVHLKHVLEHVDDVRAALATCHRLLADGGLVYVAVPNWSGELALQAAHFIPHLSLFSEASLRRLLSETGFSIIEFESDRELRVLACKDARSGAWRDGSNVVAVDEASAWARRDLGGEFGRRMTIWWKGYGGERYYDVRCSHGPLATPVGDALLAGAIGRGLSRRVARRCAGIPLAALSLRALRFELESTRSGPIVLDYGRVDPPVWIK